MPLFTPPAARCAPSPRRTCWSQRAWRVAAGLLAVTALAVTAACGGGGTNVDRGPSSLTLAADPNGVYWDASEGRRYLTDDNSNAILSWDGEGRTTFSTYAALPALAAPATAGQVSLGQLTRAADKTLYTTRFGFGNAGQVIAVSPAKVASNLSGLDPVRRRIAMTLTGAGELIDNWFTAPPSPSASTTNGAVSLLSVGAGGVASERELVTGLSKPVGTVVVGRTLYVSDQTTGKLLSFPLDAVLAAPRTAAQGTVVASFAADLSNLSADNLDLMTAGPDGTLYVGGRGGKLYSVSPTGAVTLLASINSAADPGRLQIRGLAVDAANGRLFAAVHSTDVSKAPHALRIVPL